MTRSRLPDLPLVLLTLAVVFLSWGCEESDPGNSGSPRIVSFSVAPSHLEAPGTVTVEWETTSATSLNLMRNGEEVDLGDASVAEGSLALFIEETSTFELVATGARAATVSRTRTVEVESPDLSIAIGTFTAPERVTADEEGLAVAELSWTGVVGASELILDSDPGDSISLDLSLTPDGQIEVELLDDTVFTLIARDGAASVTRTATVQVVPWPSIDDFTASRVWVGLGDVVQLEWSTTGVSEVELRANGASVEELDPAQTTGSFPLAVYSDTTVELRAFNETGVLVEESLEIVVASPTVASFDGSAASLWLGQTVTFEWASQGGMEVEIQASGLDEPICRSVDHDEIDDGSCEWQPAAVGEYQLILSVRNGSGVASERWDLYVGDGPIISKFVAEPEALNIGDEVVLSWSTGPDPDGEMPRLELLDPEGEEHLLAEAEGALTFVMDRDIGPKLFTLVATTSGPLSSPATAEATVLVHGRPEITISVDPKVFDDAEAEDIRIEWTSKHAETLVIYEIIQGVERELLEVAEESLEAGSHRLVPSDDAIYRAVATNPMGLVATAEAEVELVPPEILAFSASPEEIVAGGAVLLSWETRMAQETTLSIFSSEYVREETNEPYVDAQTLPGSVHLPLTSECSPNVLTAGCAALTLPFAFPFDGTNHHRVRVYSNGFISFDHEHTSGASLVNTRLPSEPTSPDRYVHIAPFWDSLSWNPDKYPAGNIHYLHREDEERGHSLIVQWKDASFQGIGNERSSVNFELILWEDGDFEFRYGSMEPGPDASEELKIFAEGGSATIGFQTPSQSSGDSRQFNRDLEVQGSLYGRTFLYRRAPVVASKGSYLWHPYSSDDSITVTLEARRGEVSVQESITVSLQRRPEITLALIPTEPVPAGGEIRIGWESRLADSISILDAKGDVRCEAADDTEIAAGFCVLQEEGQDIHRYTIRAVGAMGAVVEKYVDVYVYEPFGVDRFEADPPVLGHGQPLTLSWLTKNAAEVSLTADGAELLDPGYPDGPGSLTIESLSKDTLFVLRVTNALGMTVEESLLVEMWSVRLELDASATEVRPGQEILLEIEATDLAGGAAPAVFGTFPMKDVSTTSTYQDISQLVDAREIVMSSTTAGFATVEFPVGFTFPYYGEVHDSMRVFVEGFISFHPSATSTNSNQHLPNGSSTALSRVHLAPFWDDFTMRENSSVWVAQPAADTFVVQWKSASLAAGSDAATVYDLNFQVVLHSSGSFEFRYGKMDPPSPPSTSASCKPVGCANEANASSATIGYQMPDGLSGYTIHFGGTASDEGNPTFPGGIANRAFRYDPVFGSGTVRYEPTHSGTYVYCVDMDGVPACKTLEFIAEFGIDYFGAVGAERIAFGDEVTLVWEAHGGTELKIFADDLVVYRAPDFADMDRGSITFKPTQSVTYTLELTATGNVARSVIPIEVMRAELTVSAPRSAAPGEPITISWNLNKSDVALDAVMITPMEEVFAHPFSEYDLTVHTTNVFELHGSGTTSEVKTIEFEPDFTFDFLGTEMRSVQVSGLGFLSFDPSTEAGVSANSSLPNDAPGPNRVHLAPFWDSLSSHDAGRVYYMRFDADTYVIQWHRYSVAAGSNVDNPYDLNFLVVLRRNGDFEFRYGQMAPPANPQPGCNPGSCVFEANGSTATIGYQDLTGRVGHELHFSNTASQQKAVPMGLSGRSWKFTMQRASGSVQIAPWESGLYELCARAVESGELFCAEPLKVDVHWGIRSFEATPWAARPGDTIALSWEVVGLDSLVVLANEVELARFDEPNDSSGIPHVVSGATTYVLEGWSLGRVVTAELVVPVRTFDLSISGPSGRLFPGDEIELSWEASPDTPGDLILTTPMAEIPAGPADPGRFQDIRSLPGAT